MFSGEKGTFDLRLPGSHEAAGSSAQRLEESRVPATAATPRQGAGIADARLAEDFANFESYREFRKAQSDRSSEYREFLEWLAWKRYREWSSGADVTHK